MVCLFEDGRPRFMINEENRAIFNHVDDENKVSTENKIPESGIWVTGNQKQ